MASPDPRSRLHAFVSGSFEQSRVRHGEDGAAIVWQERLNELTIEVDGEPFVIGCPQFGAATAQFPQSECGCGYWSCESHQEYGVWVRRRAGYIFWIRLDGTVHSFDRDAYEAALRLPSVEGQSAADLPTLDATELAHRVDWPRQAPAALLARAPALRPLLQWPGEPAADELIIELVEPPASALQTGDAEHPLWLGRDGVSFRAYLPGVFVLPAWIAGPIVEEVAIELLDLPR